MTDGERGRGLRILILCAGNTGRSPLAEVMLRSALAEALGLSESELGVRGVEVSSAGMDAPEGYGASHRGTVLAREHGLDLSSHRSHRITEADVADADLVLCMDNAQIAAVVERFPEAGGKTELLSREGSEIPDPRHQSQMFFREVMRQIDSAIRERIPGLVERLGG